MRKILRVFGTIMFYGAGLFMFFFWFGAMSEWLGCVGSFLAVVFCPGVVIFPIVYWIVEGAFPVTYFAVWGLGILGVIIRGLATPSDYPYN